jgi:hypothetical protein
MATVRRRLIWLALYAVAMAYVESSVVVYLRAIYYPAGFSFPIVIIPDAMAAIEVGREAATLIMLAGVSLLAGADRWERFLFFCVAFGVWDIFYYVWLEVFLGWPTSPLTWDILFLIPVPWIGPVLAPVIVSAGLIGGGVWLLWLKSRGARLGFSRALWATAVAGGMLVLASFMLDYRVAFAGAEPPPFRWWLFLAGLGLGIAALVAGVRRMTGDLAAALPLRLRPRDQQD